MYKILFNIAKRFWPELESMREQRQLVGVGDVITTIYSVPLVIIGLIWLISVTNITAVQQDWHLFLLFAILLFIFNKVNYFFYC
jgi:prolipoprotein diacylglyceryltransferase